MVKESFGGGFQPEEQKKKSTKLERFVRRGIAGVALAGSALGGHELGRQTEKREVVQEQIYEQENVKQGTGYVLEQTIRRTESGHLVVDALIQVDGEKIMFEYEGVSDPKIDDEAYPGVEAAPGKMPHFTTGAKLQVEYLPKAEGREAKILRIEKHLGKAGKSPIGKYEFPPVSPDKS